MPQRRCDIVDAESPGVYHCISRCVRREALIASAERRAWIVNRLEWLTRNMAIDVIAFAVMENHLHLLLRIRPDVVREWNDREVALRRIALLPNRRTRSRRGVAADAPPTDQEVASILSSPRLLARARKELSELGFFHRLLKEPCARAWNREDGVTGHFWEGRYLSPRVLDGASLLRVARYVELNEVRACCAQSVETSKWTSARRQWERLRDAVTRIISHPGRPAEEALARIPWDPVFPCRDGRHQSEPGHDQGERARSTSLVDYLATLEFAGRCKHPAKRGWIRTPEIAVLDAVRSAIGLGNPSATSLGERLLRTAVERVRELLPIYVHSMPRDSRDFSARLPAGSCYGEPASLAEEAARRGLRRVVAIPIGL